MPVIVTFSKTLEDFWASDADYADMSDADIIDLIKEDLVAFLDGGSYTVERAVAAEER